MRYNVSVVMTPVDDGPQPMCGGAMCEKMTTGETAPKMSTEAMFNGPVARAARVWLTDHLVSKYGVDRLKAEAAVAQFGDGTLLKMILDNLPQLLQFILAIIAALG